ncbi:four helix bundle protein [Christiangramia flava]|uniref:Four helix bundle protein n=1 Tax=Christiangramia flava JLT2011 TaxID=1229726 RepID=A0A1L7I957_9FLAO|nr:four helix bundle protein [Christiangramia flava]APU69652.1 four helix bundle protein [Christiangramia flava JLT2011]
MNYFRDLKVWQKSIQLSNLIYSATKEFPKEEIYGLTSQIRRSSVSISSNIAEGCGRESKKEFKNFLGIALGSAFELETQMIIALNQNFLDKIEFDEFEKEIQHIQNMIIKLQSTL